MKTFKLFNFLFVFQLGSLIMAQNDTLRVGSFKEIGMYFTENLKSRYPELSFCRYNLISPTAGIYDLHQGTTGDPSLNVLTYLSLVNNLALSNFDNDPKINMNYIQKKMLENLTSGLYPISIAFIENYKFKNEAIAQNYVGFANNQYQDNSPLGYSVFEKDTLFASSILNQVFESKNILFSFDESLCLSNIPFDNLEGVFIDFDNGAGYVPIQNYHKIHYRDNRTYTIKLKLVVGGKVFYSSSQIIVDDTKNIEKNNHCADDALVDLPDFGPKPITTHNDLNQPVSGEYAVWYSHCNNTGKIRKPFIVSSGYNPGNSKRFLPGLITPLIFNFNGETIAIPMSVWNGEFRGTFYETYNGSYSKRFSVDEYCTYGDGAKNDSQLLDRLRDEGYDVIILGYDDGNDLTRDNAALFMKLIEIVNNEKFSNGFYFENVICGFSAGAITSRMALAKMEAKWKQNLGPHHHSKMWISFEGEHQGANLPLGLQHFFRFNSDGFYTIPSFNPITFTADLIGNVLSYISYNSIVSDNSNEILRYNVSANDGMHQNRIDLLNDFQNIPLNSSNGYPEFTRRIGISQGSGTGVKTPHDGAVILQSKLGTNLSGTAVSIPSSCGGTYTWVAPQCTKTATAKHNSSNNNGNIFDGSVILDASFTILPMTCVDLGWFGGCQCLGPVAVNIPIQIKNRNIPKPGGSNNIDDAPGSTSSTQIEAYEIWYKKHNTWWAGADASASRDTKFSAFTPTSSALDLHDPNNGYQEGYFLSPVGLDLLNTKVDFFGNLIVESNNRYGFPHLKYPTNHYQVTPFDGIYAIGDNNGTFMNGNSRPNNQVHVEDPQQFIGDYLARTEVAPEILFLTNHTVGANANLNPSYTGGYTAQYEARQKIVVGSQQVGGENIYDMYGNINHLSPNGTFKVEDNALAIFRAPELEVLDGIEMTFGVNAIYEPLEYNCSNILFISTNPNPGTHVNKEEGIAYTFKPTEDKAWEFNTLASKASFFQLYPNPSSDGITIVNPSDFEFSKYTIQTLSGAFIAEGKVRNNVDETIDIGKYKNGVYLITISDSINTNTERIILYR